MDIGIGHISLPELASLAGVTVMVIGLLVWFGNGLVQLTIARVIEFSVPSSAQGGQAISVLGGLLAIGGALTLGWSAITTEPAGPVPPAGAMPPASAVTPSAAVTPTASAPVTSPSAVTSEASVRITTRGGSAELGRDVVAAGSVGSKRFACYAVGWYVETTEDWSAYYLKQTVSPEAGGSFRTGVMEMGSPGETGSSWFPFLLGGTPAGCAWLRQLLVQTPTGEYRGAWPTAGLTPLYSAQSPIHRSF
jgi:hypothetical protein